MPSAIRLLKLGADDTTSLHELAVYSLEACPPYRALSYCWGDANPKKAIRCIPISKTSGSEQPAVKLDVTINLHTALQDLRKQVPGQLVWIDAICVNQADKTECARQVALMRDIYARAIEVLIWIGQPVPGSDINLAFDVCRQFSSYVCAVLPKRSPWNELPEIQLASAVDVALLLRPFTQTETDAIVKILDHPYWTRVWIIQEICVAASARFIAGNASLTWEDFKVTMNMLLRCERWILPDQELQFLALLEARQRYAPGEERLPLVSLAAKFRWSGATDKRDKLYALLGLCADPGITKVDYNISEADCYIRFMFSALLQSRDPSILRYCAVPKFVKKSLDLPSWVCDWRYDSTSLPRAFLGLAESNLYQKMSYMRETTFQKFHATRDSVCDPPPQLRDAKTLVLQGMTVDLIRRLAPPMELHHHFVPFTNNGRVRPPQASTLEQKLTSWRDIYLSYHPKFIIMLAIDNYRRGLWLSILMDSLQLIQPFIKGTEDPDWVLFSTMTRGAYGDNITRQMAEEFWQFKECFRTDPLIILSRATLLPYLLPPLYTLLLGFSYEHYRGSFSLISVVIWLLLLVRVLPHVRDLPLLVQPVVVWNLIKAQRDIFRPLGQKREPKMIEYVPSAAVDHRIATTEGGRVALVPHDARRGDRIILIKGSKCPFVARQKSSQWVLIGESYVYGVMQGEGWKEDACAEMEFI